MTMTPRTATSPAILVTLLLSSQLPAQDDGPPPFVRAAVDAVLQVLAADGDEAVERFLESSLDPEWVETRGTEALRTQIADLRRELPESFGEVAVEATPDGVLLLLGAGSRTHRLDVALSEQGIRGLRLLEPTSHGGPADRQQAIRGHLQLLEGAHLQSVEALLVTLDDHLSPGFRAETSLPERRRLATELRTAAAGAGNALLDQEGGDLVLTLEGPEDAWRIRFRVLPDPPFSIDGLSVEPVELHSPTRDLTWETAPAIFEELERQGLSGVVHLARDGEIVLERAMGLANRELDVPMTVDTLLGIGSTPIDFTVAALFLLAQRGALALDDPIASHLTGVPADKRTLTLRHLVTGASGLPDFHHLPTDWDADLAWIDRDTAIRRILAQPLLFDPGAGRAHSHSAYVLAAAIIEIVSGRPYPEFLRSELLEPAGMASTGFYGETLGRPLRDFAAGYGASSVGLPNIPPNWGPTSWLVMGSGGMVSTVGDILRFHRFMRSGEILGPPWIDRFRGERVGVGGSDRGFFIFEALSEGDDVAILLLNGEGRREEIRALTRALERLVLSP